MKLSALFPTVTIVVNWIDFITFSQAACDICPDGSDVPNANSVIPFLSVGNFTDPTCGQLENFARNSFVGECGLLQTQAGYCGCPGIEPVNACKLCDTDIGAPNKVTHQGDTCADIVTYVSFLSAEDCANQRGEDILAFSAFCECPGVKPNCPVCTDGVELPEPERDIPGDYNCIETVGVVETLSERQCEEFGDTILLNGFRCGCRPVEEVPECRIKQNVNMCTLSMLDAVEDECECYNFCDGVFIGCASYPGNFIQSNECPGLAISGCNYASVADNPGQSKSGSSVLSATFSLVMAIITVNYNV